MIGSIREKHLVAPFTRATVSPATGLPGTEYTLVSNKGFHMVACIKSPVHRILSCRSKKEWDNRTTQWYVSFQTGDSKQSIRHGIVYSFNSHTSRSVEYFFSRILLQDQKHKDRLKIYREMYERFNTFEVEKYNRSLKLFKTLIHLYCLPNCKNQKQLTIWRVFWVI